jgi:hypothetical protein
VSECASRMANHLFATVPVGWSAHPSRSNMHFTALVTNPNPQSRRMHGWPAQADMRKQLIMCQRPAQVRIERSNKYNTLSISDQ